MLVNSWLFSVACGKVNSDGESLSPQYKRRWHGIMRSLRDKLKLLIVATKTKKRISRGTIMSRSQEDTIEAEKYKNAILYFFKSCNNKYLGATKLNKLMYYLDFVSYRDKKKSVTGDVYLHLDYGPVPKTINNFLVKMKADELINAEDIPFKGTKKKEFTALVDPDVSVFDEYEKGLLDAICKEFQLWDTQKIVEQTHLESPWLYSEPLDTVDYEYSSDIDLFAGLSHASA